MSCTANHVFGSQAFYYGREMEILRITDTTLAESELNQHISRKYIPCPRYGTLPLPSFTVS